MPFEEYASVDQELTTSEAVSDNAIVNSILEARKEDHEESDEDEDVQDQPAARRPSTTEIQQAIEVMRRWIETTENTSDLIPGLQKFERRVETEDYRRLLSKQQNVITSYFYNWLSSGTRVTVNSSALTVVCRLYVIHSDAYTFMYMYVVYYAFV